MTTICVRRLTCLFITVAATGSHVVAGDDHETHTVRVALRADGLDGDHLGVTAVERIVESLSSGRMAIEVEEAGQSCTPGPDCVAALRSGQLDVYQAAAADLAEVFPELQVLDVPFLFEDDRVVEHVMRGPFFDRIRRALQERAGLRLMAVSHGGGWRSIATTMQPVRDPGDANGLTVLTDVSPVEAQYARALVGSEPRILSRAEMPAALDDGSVNAASIGILEIAALGLGTRLTHLTRDRHSYALTLWVMRDAAYQAVPPDLQQVVSVGFGELRRLAFAFPNHGEARALTAFEASGGHVHEPTTDERRAFVMTAGRVSTWFMDTHGPEWLVWLEEAIWAAERELGLTP